MKEEFIYLFFFYSQKISQNSVSNGKQIPDGKGLRNKLKSLFLGSKGEESSPKKYDDTVDGSRTVVGGTTFYEYESLDRRMLTTRSQSEVNETDSAASNCGAAHDLTFKPEFVDRLQRGVQSVQKQKKKQQSSHEISESVSISQKLYPPATTQKDEYLDIISNSTTPSRDVSQFERHRNQESDDWSEDDYEDTMTHM